MPYNHTLTRRLGLLVGLCLLLVGIGPVMAQTRPHMDVSPVWRPGTQLSTVSTTPDIRYVDLEIYLQGNVQFWAVSMTCTVNKAVLEGYVHDSGSSNGDPGDDIPMVSWGPEWGSQGAGGYLSPDKENDQIAQLAATGRISFTASRVGNVNPLGFNGQEYTMRLATLRFRIVDGLTRNSTSPITCSPINFLDRDGNITMRGRLVRSPNLNVLIGYSISGSAYLQGARAHANITVKCTFDPGGLNIEMVAATLSNGTYKFDAARNLGNYECLFYTNVLDAPLDVNTQTAEPYLAGSINFNLTTPTYYLLPVLLRSGNTFRDNTPGQEVIDDGNDLFLITNNWNAATAAPYLTGDANGDRKVNESDLALLAGNFDLSENGLRYDHMVFGLATSYDAIFPNSRIWWSVAKSGAVSPLVENRAAPDFWPDVSPDGALVALSRYNPRTGHYELFSVDITRAPRGRAVQLTPRTYTQDAFAPSWSPDGQRIAFICSTKTINTGWEYNEGNVCVIDADGRNLHQIAANAKVYPPTWYDNDMLIFAGLSTNPTCSNRLCYYNLATGAAGSVTSVHEPGYPGASILDMPVVRALDINSDGVPDEHWLFYRFDDATDVKIRVAKIAGDIPNNLPALGPLHGDMVIAGSANPISTTVDYYNVSPSLDIVFYEPNSLEFYGVKYTGTDLQWQDPDATVDAPLFFVDGYVGNPTWNGNPNVPTDLFALRATVEWLP